jgi:hypothetical protein
VWASPNAEKVKIFIPPASPDYQGSLSDFLLWGVDLDYRSGLSSANIDHLEDDILYTWNIVDTIVYQYYAYQSRSGKQCITLTYPDGEQDNKDDFVRTGIGAVLELAKKRLTYLEDGWVK